MSYLAGTVALVGEGAAAALAHAAAGERNLACRLLIALDCGYDHPHPHLRRYVRAQIVRIEKALGLPSVDDEAFATVVEARS